MPRPGNAYIFDQGWGGERERLTGLSSQYDDVSLRHLRELGVGAGWHCWEAGAGAGSMARHLVALLGGTGRLVATDRDPRFLRELEPTGVEVFEHDLTGTVWLPGQFDLVYSRAVLAHTPQRNEVVANLARCLRPGGVLLVEDVVFGGPLSVAFRDATSDPIAAALLVRMFDAIAAGFRAVGAEPMVGARLPGMVRAAGLVDVAGEVVTREVKGGTAPAAFYSLSLAALRPRLIDEGWFDAEDADRIDQFLRDPNARWFSVSLGSASGRRPA